MALKHDQHQTRTQTYRPWHPGIFRTRPIAVAVIIASVGFLAASTAAAQNHVRGRSVRATVSVIGAPSFAGSATHFRLRASVPTNDSLAAYRLTYGDGTHTVRGKRLPRTVSHTFSHAGKYIVALWVRDRSQVRASARAVVTVSTVPTPGTTAPKPPVTQPTPAPVATTPTSTATPTPTPTTTTTPTTPGTLRAVWPDGSPVANMQMVFIFGWRGGEYQDLATDASGQFPMPDFSRCDVDCELWIGTPDTAANLQLVRTLTGDAEDACRLPLTNNTNPQIWDDIQFGPGSAGTLYVAGTDCDEEETFDFAIGGWHQSYAASQISPKRWLTTADLEQLNQAGVLDESQPLGSGSF